jgi:hypothetical protein
MLALNLALIGYRQAVQGVKGETSLKMKNVMMMLPFAKFLVRSILKSSNCTE